MRTVLAVTFYVFVFVDAFCIGCVKPLPLSPPPDADDAQVAPPAPTLSASGSVAIDLTGCESACANLLRLGCPEGLRINCVESCRKGEEITELRPHCLAEAGSREAVRRCGTLGPEGGCAP